jgi:glycosyltransferase involved in cell wall biosynthesis
MIAYNHERFIVQAIDRVIMQKAEFPFELVIGDDCSTDNTRLIVESYVRKYPDIIRLLPAGKNLGGVLNCSRTLMACRGKYIAMCEGDDYWTSSDKLAKQVECLDNNPDISICFHNVLVQYEGGDFPPYPYYLNNLTEMLIGIHDDKPPEISDVSRLLRGNFIQTPSIMMRNIFTNGFPEWFAGLGLADWPLNVLSARNGRIRYMDEIMAVYRVHSGGVWSCVGIENKSNAVIKAAYAIRENVALSLRHLFILNSYICNMHIYSAQRLLREGNRFGAMSRVVDAFSEKGNKRPAFILAFVFSVSRRLLPQKLFDCLFSLRRKLMCRK